LLTAAWERAISERAALALGIGGKKAGGTEPAGGQRG
jgi:hypothetical protein